MMKTTLQLPVSYHENVQRAVEILKRGGCTDIFLFGALVTSNVHQHSDIDLAVRGCPKGTFFHLLGKLLLELDYPVDLVNLESQDAFARYLEQEGELIQLDYQGSLSDCI